MSYRVYGERSDGSPPPESVEMSTFFNRLRTQYPKTYGAIAIHVRNEGRRTQGAMRFIKSEGGFVKGASDIMIPGNPTFVCEMKSRAKTSRLSKEQIEYLEAAHAAGAFACVAFGYEAAWEAFQEWVTLHQK